MKNFEIKDLKNLYLPAENSHKGQNGKLLVIGGSELFHAASIWALSIASKIVDMVFYSSVPINNKIVIDTKKEFRNGIVVPREDIENYINEADCILLGPGMVRKDSRFKTQDSRFKNLQEINKINDEGEQTYWLTKYLLEKYPSKKWVIDAGALQMLEQKDLLSLKENAIITPHAQEFERVFSLEGNPENVSSMAEAFKITILYKSHADIVCSYKDCFVIQGGNAGMTKGGTGDVLAGLCASLFCKNNAFLSASAASFFNKKAGESLFERVGYYFNSSDLVEEIPKVMKKYLL